MSSELETLFNRLGEIRFEIENLERTNIYWKYMNILYCKNNIIELSDILECQENITTIRDITEQLKTLNQEMSTILTGIEGIISGST